MKGVERVRQSGGVKLVTHFKLSLKSSVFVREAADITTDLDKMKVC